MTKSQNEHSLSCIITVTEETGRVDQFLTEKLSLSRSRVIDLIKNGHILKAGKTFTPSYKIKPDDTFDVSIPEPEPDDLIPEDIPLEILYEDKDIVVINKPADLVVHPAAGHHTGTLANALLGYLGDDLSGIGGVKRPGIVHRLDKGTSGVMVIAKNDLAHQSLSEQFADREVDRVYQVIVRGEPIPQSGRIENNIGRSKINRQKMQILRKGGRDSITDYKILKRLPKIKCSLVECTIYTGRTHQIRVHMASLKTPVLGDTVYGRGKSDLINRQAVHAMTLSFDHPRTGKRMTFSAELPEDMARLVNSD